jgi:hypothetical protein
VCDDGNRCTTDRCDAATGCVSTSLPGLAGADCTLGALQTARLCAATGLDPKLARSLARRVAKARVLVVKAMQARSSRLVARLAARADRQLAAVLAEARRAVGRRVGAECFAEIARALGDSRAALAQSLPVR